MSLGNVISKLATFAGKTKKPPKTTTTTNKPGTELLNITIWLFVTSHVTQQRNAVSQ